MFSAEMELGIPSQPLITAPPLCQIDLTLFSLTVSPKVIGLERVSFIPGVAYRARYCTTGRADSWH
jgi:hypothetical protein